ncbi:RICIN domain-containing protein [Actinokineospora spheciospongiae]|nr:ricin-type beta-trefoil lectin domain protein [Actinokineospora spheciospongiae]
MLPAGMWDCHGGPNQKWYSLGADIRSLYNSRCLEILNYNNNNGAPVGMWDCYIGGNQLWY